MTRQPPPKAFVSHSHADHVVATQLGTALRAHGVDAWLDKWEIDPGDSLIQRIFREGLADCTVFLVLLSPESIASRWVREELDVALIQRLEGATRVIPVIVKPCQVPVPLRGLLWLDVTTTGIEATAVRISDVACGRTQRPPLGPAPGPSRIRNVPGLSDFSGAVALALAAGLSAVPEPTLYTGSFLAERLSLQPEQVNDAVDELEGLGLAKTLKALGTHPFQFYAVRATYRMALHLEGTGAIDYDPEDDIISVAASIAALRFARGSDIVERIQMVPSRVNHAVEYLNDHGLVQVLRALDTTPFLFAQVSATSATRRFVAEHAK